MHKDVEQVRRLAGAGEADAEAEGGGGGGCRGTGGGSAARRAPVILADSSNLIVHLAPVPVVARVATTMALIRPDPGVWLTRSSTWPASWRERARRWSRRAMSFHPARTSTTGLHLTFWRFVEHLETTPDLTDVAGSLADLHEVLRDYPGELPFLAPALEDVERGLDYLEAHAPIATEDLELLRSMHARVVAAIAGIAEEGQALHGDAHAGTCWSPQKRCSGTTSRTPAAARSRGTWPASPTRPAGATRRPSTPTGGAPLGGAGAP